MGNAHHYRRPTGVFKAGFIATIAGGLLGTEHSAVAVPTNAWSFKASVAVRETFDDNVFLQSKGPKAKRESMVTSVLPQVSATWKPGDAFDATIGYNAGLNWFHSESSQDHTIHRAIANGNARFGDTKLESQNSIVGIDGDDVGPTWASPGAVPAAGGPAVRDRYDAIVFRNSLRVTHAIGDWFVRPSATWYAHDWGTDERNTPGYQNYADRTEWTAGPDLGQVLKPGLSTFIGYRFGEQSQEQVLRFPEQYESAFHRVLFGVEGKPAKWLSTTISIGPEFRSYANDVPAEFDRSRVNLFVDAAVCVTPTESDMVSVSAKQFQQPGFSGRSAYTDLTFDFEWRRKLGKQVVAGVGTRAYNTYFLRPAKRNDWVVTPNLFVNYAVTTHWSVEASGGHEIGFTGNEGYDARDYDRTFVNLGVKYTWR